MLNMWGSPCLTYIRKLIPGLSVTSGKGYTVNKLCEANFIVLIAWTGNSLGLSQSCRKFQTLPGELSLNSRGSTGEPQCGNAKETVKTYNFYKP